MACYRALTIVLLSMSIAACAGKSYPGTRQENLTATICPIALERCHISHKGLSGLGKDWRFSGYYSLKSTADAVYTPSGKVRLEFDDPATSRLEFPDLVLVFFGGEIAVHEEKIRVAGRKDFDLEFSESFESDREIEASDWVWFDWRARG